MKLSRLALTVIEDSDHPNRFHWIFMEATGSEVDQIREFAASEDPFSTAQAAFDDEPSAGGPKCQMKTKTPTRSATAQRMPT